MSMILTARALQIKTGNPLRKLVLVKLADNANDQGEAWPSVAYIAEQCEISVRSVQNHITELEKMGLLRTEFRKSANGLNQSNIYHLLLREPVNSGAGNAPSGANNAGGSGAGDSKTGAGDAPRISKDPVIDPNNKNIKSRSEKSKAKTSLPDDFKPTAIHGEKALSAGLVLNDEFEKFCDYHASKGSMFIDWNRAFNYWLGQAKQFKPQKNTNSSANIDIVERDSAFSRLIGSRSKPQNRIEEIALELAGKTGIRRMSEFSGRQAWNSIWKQATEMSQEAQQ
ncbi:helix-turn-helix domain-containing protein [Proteus penneri]|uniref:helix-turn-helix domain-containing protein n=1 Tax=Proteus penneri TaxID=102862 RepID=UPI0034D49AA8